jgi:hypothetical protein
MLFEALLAFTAEARHLCHIFSGWRMCDLRSPLVDAGFGDGR